MPTTLRKALLASAFLMAALAVDSAESDVVTIPLHVLPGFVLQCDETSDPCSDGTINLVLEKDAYTSVVVYLKGYPSASSIQTAFTWPLEWEFWFGLLCQPGTGGGPYSPGPGLGTLSAAFNDCLTGGLLTPIAHLILRPTSPGCLEQIESSYPHGTHIVTCDDKIVPVGPAQRGSVCVGPGGVNACDVTTPVAATTWGRIKRQY